VLFYKASVSKSANKETSCTLAFRLVIWLNFPSPEESPPWLFFWWTYLFRELSFYLGLPTLCVCQSLRVHEYCSSDKVDYFKPGPPELKIAVWWMARTYLHLFAWGWPLKHSNKDLFRLLCILPEYWPKIQTIKILVEVGMMKYLMKRDFFILHCIHRCGRV
jgi:hypothetical protein